MFRQPLGVVVSHFFRFVLQLSRGDATFRDRHAFSFLLSSVRQKQRQSAMLRSLSRALT
jgi:hypothetical protein